MTCLDHTEAVAQLMAELKTFNAQGSAQLSAVIVAPKVTPIRGGGMVSKCS